MLHPFTPGHLLFLRYTATSPMTRNRYGIAEPELDMQQVVPHSTLDLICTPLVAFDATGNRLGMGGGYYDRTLACWHEHRLGPKPLGLAHDCQQVDAVPQEEWDVPLPQIITPAAAGTFPARTIRPSAAIVTPCCHSHDAMTWHNKQANDLHLATFGPERELGGRSGGGLDIMRTFFQRIDHDSR